LADERAMPAEDRLRRDEERSPAFPGYETGEHADQRSSGPGEPGTGNLAAKPGQLVGEAQGSRHPLPPHPTRGQERPQERAGTNGRARTGRPGEPRRASFDWSNPVGGFWTLQASVLAPIASPRHIGESRS